MPLATDVKLLKTCTPSFPDRCIRCGAISPGATYAVRKRTAGWLTVLIGYSGDRFTSRVPACAPCASRLARQRWFDTATKWILASGSMLWALWLLQTYEGPAKKW